MEGNSKIETASTQASPPPILKQDGEWARTDQEKADIFAEHLAQVFTPNPRIVSPEEEKIYKRSKSTPCQPAVSESFTKNKVKLTLKLLNDKKAPGYDLITRRILKELPGSGIQYLTHLFNAILRTGSYPPQWKMA